MGRRVDKKAVIDDVKSLFVDDKLIIEAKAVFSLRRNQTSSSWFRLETLKDCHVQTFFNADFLLLHGNVSSTIFNKLSSALFSKTFQLILKSCDPELILT